jgi:hypothetical protein
MAKHTKDLRRHDEAINRPSVQFTVKQGQYLAYIHLYRKLHRQNPSEIEIAEYFRVSPPSAHQMIVHLEDKGLITRKPGVPRSIRVAVPSKQLPALEDDDEHVPPATVPIDEVLAERTQLYTLEIFIIGGPVTEKFAKRNPVVSRTIKIRGDQTLGDLHRAIFDAFGRSDEHMYEFQFGKGPNDPKSKRYVLPGAFELHHSEPGIAGELTQTTIDSLGLKVDQAFGYWFDFGDDWWHQINVVAIDDNAPKGKYPKVVKRVGKSPPQYADEDE